MVVVAPATRSSVEHMSGIYDASILVGAACSFSNSSAEFRVEPGNTQQNRVRVQRIQDVDRTLICRNVVVAVAAAVVATATIWCRFVDFGF